MKRKCFCGLSHGDYKTDEEALLHDAYHDIYQGALPDKEWMEAVFELLNEQDTKSSDPVECEQKDYKPVKCDKCNLEATRATRDLIEGDPEQDEDGSLWSTWSAKTKWRYGCDRHLPQRSKLYRKDGNEY